MSELKKYTYSLVGIRSKDGGHLIYPIGSCFFIRKGPEIFLVTARHNISGNNTFNLQPTPNQYDTIGFRYFHQKTKQLTYSSLNILDLKKLLPNDYFYQSPDAVALKMNDPEIEPYLLSIENYIFDLDDSHNLGDSILGYGFGLSDPSKFSDTSEPISYIGNIADTLKGDPAYPVRNDLYYTANPISTQGLSGAPVFYRCKRHVDGKPAFRFAGVIFGTNDRFNLAYIVPAANIELQVQSSK